MLFLLSFSAACGLEAQEEVFPGNKFRYTELRLEGTLPVSALSMVRRNTRPGASRCCCPHTSASVLGRRRCASGSFMVVSPFLPARHFLYSIAHLEKEDKAFSENHSQIMPCKHLQILSNMV